MNKLSKKQIQSIIKQLQYFQKNTFMYICPLTVEGVDNYLLGFENSIIAIFSISIFSDTIRIITLKRGWKSNNSAVESPIIMMKKKGYGADKIISELIQIEIDIWNYFLDNYDELKISL